MLATAGVAGLTVPANFRVTCGEMSSGLSEIEAESGGAWGVRRMEVQLRGEARRAFPGRPTGTIRTFPLAGIRSDRVRLIVPNPPLPGKREVYYEIEVYRAKQR